MKFAHASLACMALAIAGGVALSGCAAPERLPVVSAVSTQDLLGVQWTAVAIGGVAQVQPPRPTVRWTAAQQIVGSGGCNQFRGRAVLNADSLHIGPIAGFGTACLTTPTGQEDMFFKAIENTAKARLEDGQLVLLDARGKVLARLESSERK